ncbi:hypothetical protein [Paenibacillus sp.]|jgi:hypothetical protein|uniref:hypothetical protein n=1 Tax=Paenibacillus sp. TaxID=58172 RepID=UPI0028279594|nr:hypothetical protein [Paenibacillus sp.]MDR0268148.1 hypothetical protein [Paenibacillus sp.]
MKFSDYKYERPDIQQIKEKFRQLVQTFESAERLEDQEQAITEINHLRSTTRLRYFAHSNSGNG